MPDYISVEEAFEEISEYLSFYNDLQSQPLSGDVQVGATATTIIVDPTTPGGDDTYVNWRIEIRTGAARGQKRVITDYDEGTKTATVANWTTIPGTDSAYTMSPIDEVQVEEDIDQVEAEINTAVAVNYEIPILEADHPAAFNMIKNFLRPLLKAKAIRRGRSNGEGVSDHLQKEIDWVRRALKDIRKGEMELPEVPIKIPDSKSAKYPLIESNKPLMKRDGGLISY